MLQGLRVLDWTNESGFLAGRILGDLGADVIKIEPPGGDLEGRRTPTVGGVDDPERSLSWLANNTSKRGIVLDLASETGLEQYRALAQTADVILETFAPGWLDGLGVGYAALASGNPGLVHCGMTPFGQTGPYASFRAHDLVLVAMGGNMAGTGDPGRPPVRSSMPTAYYHAGPEAALAVLMALYQRERTGRGEFIDLSLHETQLQTLLTGAGQYPLTGRIPERSGPRMGRTREIWRASDGMVSYGLRGGQTRIPNLRATVKWMAEADMAPSWLREYDWDSYSHLEVSNEDLARIEDAFAGFFASRTVRELYAGALERRILLAPCNNAREILEHVQLRSRELFRRVDYTQWNVSLEHPDFFAKFRNHPVHIRRQPPGIGEHQEEVLREIRDRSVPEIAVTPTAGETDIFSGLHVLEIGSGAAGPVATRYFAEHGAHVIRVESGVRPDFLRILFLTSESRFGVDGSPMFVLLNGNKDSVTL
ncbi:MAG: CoA transferase, partial [Myxococcota bacterium]